MRRGQQGSYLSVGVVMGFWGKDARHRPAYGIGEAPGIERDPVGGRERRQRVEARCTSKRGRRVLFASALLMAVACADARAPVGRVTLPRSPDPQVAPTTPLTAGTLTARKEPVAGIDYQSVDWTLTAIDPSRSKLLIRFMGAECADSYVSLFEGDNDVGLIAYRPREPHPRCSRSADVAVALPSSLGHRTLYHLSPLEVVNRRVSRRSVFPGAYKTGAHGPVQPSSQQGWSPHTATSMPSGLRNDEIAR
jgi:hypothetical protein